MEKRIKTGGRKKGTPNRFTDTKKLLQDMFYKHIESRKFESALTSLQGEKYIDAVLKIAPYVVSKPTASSDIRLDVIKQILPSWLLDGEDKC